MDDRVDATNVYTCPACGGALQESLDAGMLRFGCKVGHRYSEESLLYLQGQQLETALWAALRALDDRVQLTRSVAARMELRGGGEASASRYRDEAAEAGRHAQTLRTLLEQTEAMASHDPAVAEAAGEP
jgi:two-component system chemotaxis response regulator CheB